MITYGLDSKADFSASDIKFTEQGTTFMLYHKGSSIVKAHSPLQGYHNLRNLLGAIAVAYDLEVPLEAVMPATRTFSGVSRRLEFAGEVGGVKLYDDYAHHPTEIKATLEGMRRVFDGRLVAVFQPHLYSRTKRFYKEFGGSFSDADMVVILGIYPAREEPLNGVSGKMIADAAKKTGHTGANYVEDKEDLPNFLRPKLHRGDRVILFGAGDIYKYTNKILELLKE
jgi:UDP-N-acetylmuramate--alanine ligase